METLYEIVEKYQMLLTMAESEDVNEEAFQEALESISDDIEAKADNYARIMANLDIVKGGLEGKLAAIEKEAQRIKDKITTLDNRKDNMKKNLCSAMQSTGKTKFKTDFFSFWVQKSTPAVVIDDEANIPMDFYTVPEPKVSKSAIKEALTKGEVLPFAHLESHEIVRIK